MSKLEQVPIDAINPNPFRRLHDYPYVESKLAALMQSIKDVGLWEGLIGRKAGNRYDLAFGHHRLEAAKRAKIKTVPLIVRDLTEEQMLSFMGRENMEDYNADFLCMLETWEAAQNYKFKNGEMIDIARFLGWLNAWGKASVTASACHNALYLINNGHMARDDLLGMTVSEVKAIVERVHTRITQLSKMAEQERIPAAQAKAAQAQIAKAGKYTAKQVRKGHVLQRDVSNHVDTSAYYFAKEAKQQTPVFELFVKIASDTVEKMLNKDATAQRIQEIVKVMGDITKAKDRLAVARLDFELEQLGERVALHKKSLVPIASKLKYLPGGKQ